LRGGTEENREIFWIAGVPAEIRTQHFPTTTLMRYRYTNVTGGYGVEEFEYLTAGM
jgi:hypothetical protein